MLYGPGAEMHGVFPYNAIMASLVLVLASEVAAAGAEPNISEPAGAPVWDGTADGPATLLDMKSAKRSASGCCCDCGDTSATNTTASSKMHTTWISLPRYTSC